MRRDDKNIFEAYKSKTTPLVPMGWMSILEQQDPSAAVSPVQSEQQTGPSPSVKNISDGMQAVAALSQKDEQTISSTLAQYIGQELAAVLAPAIAEAEGAVAPEQAAPEQAAPEQAAPMEM